MLSMSLIRSPRLDDVTIQQMRAVEYWFSYCNRPVKYQDDSFENWCGLSEDALPSQEVIKELEPYYVARFAPYDTEHRWGSKSILHIIDYWNGGNHVHKWFVDHVQNGKDDYKIHQECTKIALEELLDACKHVIASVDPAHAAKKWLLSDEKAQEQYNEYSDFDINGVERTMNIIENVLATTDFKKQKIYYCSHWSKKSMNMWWARNRLKHKQ